MSHELERWNPGFANEDTGDDIQTYDLEPQQPDIIDVEYSFVNNAPVYEPEPMPSDSNGWGGGAWLEPQIDHEDDTYAPVEYAEPDVIDTPFTFYEPDTAQYPVKWGAGWFGGNSQAREVERYEPPAQDAEIERYVNASFDSEPDVTDGMWQPVGEQAALENPYQRSTDDFFRTVEVGENPEPEPEPVTNWWAQTAAATAQASDVVHDVSTQQPTSTKQHSEPKTRTQSQSVAKRETRRETHSEPDVIDAVATWLGFDGGSEPPTPTPPAYSGGSSEPFVSGESGSSKSPGWYFIANDDANEDPDVWALRHWYFTYEFGDGFEEWDEVKFHEWYHSLSGKQRQLYIDAGNIIMDNELVSQLKEDSQLKTAYRSMRLEGDAPSSQRNEPIGRVAAWVLRGFS